MKTDNSDKVKYYTRFCDMVENIAEDRQDSPAILWFSRGGEKHSVTYGKLRDDVRCLQSYFVEHDYAKKHIAILGENSYE